VYMCIYVCMSLCFPWMIACAFPRILWATYSWACVYAYQQVNVFMWCINVYLYTFGRCTDVCVNMHMSRCVYMYISRFVVYMYIHAFVYMHTFVYSNIMGYMQLSMCIYIYIYMCTYLHTYVCICVFKCVFVCVSLVNDRPMHIFLTIIFIF